MNKTLAGLLGAALIVGGAGAVAAAPSHPTITFFSAGGSSASWGVEAGNKVLRLSIDAGSYAGAYFVGAAGDDLGDVTAPSFDLKAAAGPSNGAPRLVVRLSDGGDLSVRAETLTGAWQTVDATTGDVDSRGGTCGWAYDQTWLAAQNCHVGATVTSVYFVTDGGEHTALIDDIEFNGKTWGGPSGNA